MQGRLSPIIDGKIQSFPKENWRQEFIMARKLGLFSMEWTLDAEGLYENPLLKPEGRVEIHELCLRNNIAINSLTGDCFMQRPFWKENDPELKRDFCNIVRAASACSIQKVVVPLVDEGRLEDINQRENLVGFLLQKEEFLFSHKVQICFESDFAPLDLKYLIDEFPRRTFGINYDTGNSASLGWDVEEEFAVYGDRIYNIHIKDRVLHGTTVNLGAGAVNFEHFFNILGGSKYSGDLILQTARATDNDHSGQLLKFANFVKDRCSYV